MKKRLVGMLFMSMLILTGCGNGSNSATSTDSQNNAPGSLNSTNEQLIADLENSGEIPTLDRSSDIKGSDTDDNGIRDDIDTYIESMPITDEQKKAVIQLARSMQDSLLVDTKNDVALQNDDVKSIRAIQCLDIKFDDIPMERKILISIESKTANTKERAMKYIQYNNALSGSASQILTAGDTCDE